MTTGMSINVKNGKLIIEVPVDKASIERAPMSKSGKSKLVASTRGFTAAPGSEGLSVSLNVTADK